MRASRAMTGDPEVWASIFGWHCWCDAAGSWYARRADATTAVVLRAGSLDDLRASIDSGTNGVYLPASPVREPPGHGPP
jgi:hypothetical protein